ncbi:hypothetical protein [Reticulibacter mediterranei]|uniref:hypothetical protein n=1 Tax=Reticulibacter mediterranei TaxID=2778369 RepID=UPI001C687856|nr:hypothetical protein [Reticulibacter mediterranei]
MNTSHLGAYELQQHLASDPTATSLCNTSCSSIGQLLYSPCCHICHFALSLKRRKHTFLLCIFSGDGSCQGHWSFHT